MLNNNLKETFKPQEWWVKAFTTNKESEEAFPSPACEFAEHRFLSFLFLLDSITRNKKELQQTRVKSLAVYSYNSDNILEATGIQKVQLRAGFVFSRKFYDFYEDTHLVLTGPLAGTIAQSTPHHTFSRIKKHGLPVTSIRPLHNHSLIHGSVSAQITLTQDKAKSKKEVELKHRIALLQKVELIIKKHGYIQSLLLYLDKLGLEHNAAAIRYNSKQ